MTITELQNRSYETAVAKGFVGLNNRTIGDQLMLAVGELSEALEEIRNGRAANEVYYSEGGKPEGFPVEVADCIIRLAQLAEESGFDLEGTIRIKMDYNATRPFRHGGKLL